MKRVICLFVIASLAVVLAACNLPKGEPPQPDNAGDVATRVAATMQFLTQSAPQALQTPLATSTLPLPTLTSSPTMTHTLAITLTPMPGTIAGSIVGYPYGSVPRLVIVAFDQETTYLNYWYWITSAGQTYYSMDNYIPPSTYQVVAYDSSGHVGGCAALVVVTSTLTSRI